MGTRPRLCLANFGFAGAIFLCLPLIAQGAALAPSSADLDSGKTPLAPSSIAIQKGKDEIQKMREFHELKTDYCKTEGANPQVCSDQLRDKTCPPGYTFQTDTTSASGNQICRAVESSETPMAADPQKPDDKAPGTQSKDTSKEKKAKTAPARNQDNEVPTNLAGQAQQCRDAARSASETCSSAVGQVDSLKSQFNAMTARLGNQSGANACGQMANESGQISNQMQSLRNSCGQAVSSCSSSCASTLSALGNFRSSSAYVMASEGDSVCQSASTRLSNIDMNLNQVQSVASQSQRCYQDITGSSPSSGATDPSQSARRDTSKMLGDSLSSGGSSSLGYGDSTTGVRVTPPQTAPTSNSASDGRLTLGDRENESSGIDFKNPYQSSQKSGSPPSGSSLSSGVRASGSGPSGSGSGRGGPSDSRFNKNVLEASYGESGQRLSRNMKSSQPMQWQVTSQRQGQVAAQKKSDTVDLRRFAPSISRNPANLGNPNGIGGRHGNIFKSIAGRYMRVADSLNP